MAKNKILLFTFLNMIIIYLFLILVNVNGVNLSKFWFGVALFFIGFYAIMYFISFNLDSSLYYGVLLILIGISSILKFTNLLIIKILPLYFISFAIAHLAIFAIFRQIIHLKLFAILFLEIIIIVNYKLSIIDIKWFIIINALFAGIIIVNCINRLIRNLRRK